MSISRRAFLGAAALSPLGVTTFAASGKLPTRTFGSTGAQVPLLAFGCGTRFLAYKDDDEALGVLSRAIDLGFTYIDTANNYGNGKSEERVGRLMSTRRREGLPPDQDRRAQGGRGAAPARGEPEAPANRSTGRPSHPRPGGHERPRRHRGGGRSAQGRPAGPRREAHALHRHHRPRESGEAMQAALERHGFDCVQMALNAARARMMFDDKGPHPASYEALALPVAVEKKMGIIAMKVFGQDQLRPPPHRRSCCTTPSRSRSASRPWGCPGPSSSTATQRSRDRSPPSATSRCSRCAPRWGTPSASNSRSSSPTIGTRSLQVETIGRRRFDLLRSESWARSSEARGAGRRVTRYRHELRPLGSIRTWFLRPASGAPRRCASRSGSHRPHGMEVAGRLWLLSGPLQPMRISRSSSREIGNS